MKSTRWAIFAAILSFAFAAISLYFAFAFHFGTQLLGASTFSVDQMLATLTLVVGLVGLVVAVTAIAVAIVAVFGYGEIRQITTRRADEVLRKVIYGMRKRGEISSLEAQAILQTIDEEQLRENEPQSANDASKGEDKEKTPTEGTDNNLKKYPSS